MNTFFKSAALAVLAFITISLAGVASASAQNSSDIEQSGPCNVALVGQAGSNWSLVDQDNYGSCSKGNSAAVLQLGSSAQYTGQFGKNHEALTIQIGDDDFAGTFQNGKGDDSSIIQIGDGDIAGAYQDGRHDDSSIIQIGDGDIAGVIQLGDDHSSSIQQIGDGNLAVVIQTN